MYLWLKVGVVLYFITMTIDYAISADKNYDQMKIEEEKVKNGESPEAACKFRRGFRKDLILFAISLVLTFFAIFFR